MNLLKQEYELDWNDGSVDQIQYFTLGEEESYNGGGSRSCTPLSISSTVGLSAPIMRRGRRSNSSETEGEGISKGIFVKPSQVSHSLLSNHNTSTDEIVLDRLGAVKRKVEG